MKVGEAGEAFFVVETEGDVPDELLTSPLLTATTAGVSPTSLGLMMRWGQVGRGGRDTIGDARTKARRRAAYGTVVGLN